MIKKLVWVPLLCLLMTTIVTVSPTHAKIFSIGVITTQNFFIPCVVGFKAGMAEFGYIEGQDVRYIFNGIIQGGDERIDAEIENLFFQNVDMFFTIANEVTLRTKAALKGTDIPIVFTSSLRPVEEGIAKSLLHPDGNLTGVRVADHLIKSLEWLCKIVPEAKQVFLPYNPDDKISLISLAGLDGAAAKLGIKLVVRHVSSVQEAVAIIESLPDDIDAIFRIPSRTLDARNIELSRAAIERVLPMGSTLALDETVLFSFGVDYYEAGRQAARLAHMIHQGTKPGDIPIETSDAYLTINLKTAEKIGLHIADEVLIQAKTIIR